VKTFLGRLVKRHDKKSTRAADGPLAWRGRMKRRITIAAVCFATWAGAIEARLVYLQILHHAELVVRAERQQRQTFAAPAERGDILDRKGRVLATSVDAETIYAVPTEISDVASTVKQLCDALGDCTKKERQQLAEKFTHQKAFAYVRRQVSPDEAKRVAALNLDGIAFMKESRRFYPNKELAAHLLGYVGIDNVGLSGLENTYDPQIRGKAGTILVHTDARRHPFSRVEHPPTAGSTVELTIDGYLQYIAERELRAGVRENGAAGGTAIIMNPHTGEILAMASEPTFNPNAYRDSQESERRNRAVQDLYEPGSTFKVVTASAAIEEKIMPLNTMIDVSGGQIRIDRSRIVHDTHNYGVLSFTDVIVKSSNVGAIKIGFKLGTERLSEYVNRYGFGHPVSADFPGESPGIVWRPDKWTDSALASVSMGYQVGVTPLQMVAAVSAVANGGEYVEPRVLRAIYQDGRRYAVQPKIVRRTISPDTAAAMTSIMEGVVERGTATRAQIPGYTIAGKTGTSAKLINGHYSSSDWNASFVGFLPSRDPQVAIIVVTDSPHTQGHTGGVVSAPVWRRIAEATLQYLGIGPTLNPAPPVLVAKRDGAMPVKEGEPQDTPPVLTFVSDDESQHTVPDVRGMSAREAVQKLVKLGLTPKVSGDGVVVSQEPPGGTALDAAHVCRLVLERPPTRRQQNASQP
jgi:cell division protein FtsI (penicillin-binding protein 3)